ncbi:MAG: fenitrothion hydrolase, partial [Actinomycetota bacterium]|nr:fenitrothion hydrolase [Actinomycetota bacterium]
IVGRADLPIPAELFGAAAAAVLVVSFAALAAGWSRPRLERPRERALLRLPVAVDVVLGGVGVLAFGLVVYAGLAGTDSQRENLAPTAVYVVFWVGIPLVSLLLGDVFRLLSPWRAIGRAAGWVARRVGGDALPEPLPYPERLGHWPAVAGLLAFGLAELCFAAGREPTPLALFALAYLVVALVGMSLYGVEPWTRRGDAFGAYFSLFASLAPLARREGRLGVRAPAAGATGLRAIPGTVALLIVAIATTAFDGAKEGPVFSDAAPRLQDAFSGLGASKGLALELAFVAGYAAMVALVAAIWWAAVRGMPRARAGLGRGQLGRRLAHSLIPIAAAYVLAHYFSLLAYGGQDAVRLASDPLGEGADLLGTADRAVDYGVVSATAIWYVQVAALVVGHVAALVLGHDRALALYGSARAAARSQFVMLIVMVCFTCLGLYLLSAPNA